MPEINYSDDQINDLIKGIYSGEVDPTNLPEDLYNAVSDHLLNAVKEGFTGVMELETGVSDMQLLSELRENIYLFSAARTFQQTLEMSDALLNDKGELRSLKEFKDAALEIYTKYNGGDVEGEINQGWIATEYNTAIAQAGNAKKWNDIQDKKELLPYLRWVAVGDELECEICGELNGTTLPVDDDFWDENAPAVHFNCRCILEQLELEEGQDSETPQEDLQGIEEKAGVPDEFKFNAGKDREIFSTSGISQHPYFDVPKEYTEFAKENFGLPIPLDKIPTSLDANTIDGELTESRKLLHERIINDMKGNAVEVENPTIYMNGGGTASGKSSVTDKIAQRPKEIMHVDSDQIKDLLPEYVKMLDRRDKTAASYVHEESSMISKDALKLGVDSKYNVVLDGTGDGTYESLANKVAFMKSNGARVVADYVTMNTDLSVKLQQKRFEKTGRFVPEKVLRETHKNVSIVVPEAIKNNLFDEFRLWDTNIQNSPRLVAEYKNGEFKIYKKDLWQDFVNKADQ